MKKWTVLKVGLVSAIMITTPVSAAYAYGVGSIQVIPVSNDGCSIDL